MTNEDYTKALDRAHSNGLQIVGRGWWKPTGERVIGVTSASQPGTVHVVIVKDLNLQCDCIAAEHGRYCQHRALVHELLLTERFEKSDARIGKLERDLQRVALEVVRLREKSSGEDAPLSRPAGPVSIFR
jgi:hypothetical protein